MYKQGIQLLATLMFSIASTGVIADELDDFERLSSIADAEYQHITDTSALEYPPFVHDKVLRIKAANLDDPWVRNSQCHSSFPLFPDLQIAFSQDSVRAIQLTQRVNVERAWVEGSTVQMKQTRPETRLCFESENRVFHRDIDSDTYLLRVGPYFLRLFDGYFPIRVKLRVVYPDELLELISLAPDELEGAEVKFGNGEISFEDVFEGRLELEFRFKRSSSD